MLKDLLTFKDFCDKPRDYSLDENMYVEDVEPTESMLFEMSNLNTKRTGLNELIWVSGKNANHGPRIKVFEGQSPSGRNFSVTIENEPKVVGISFVSSKELKNIIKFIKLNKDTLLKYWEYVIDTESMINSIKPITNSFD